MEKALLGRNHLRHPYVLTIQAHILVQALSLAPAALVDGPVMPMLQTRAMHHFGGTREMAGSVLEKH